MKKSPSCKFRWLILFWALFIPWALYSYFVGENSLRTLSSLKKTEEILKREKEYWEERNKVLELKLASIKRNKQFYYDKLAREMFVRGKKKEEVILFVK
ncbi:FtsB family cell division protein [Thermovibrio sp.]